MRHTAKLSTIDGHQLSQKRHCSELSLLSPLVTGLGAARSRNPDGFSCGHPFGTAEGRDFLMHARIGMLRALNRHVERVFDPSRKETHWGRRKLARDRPVSAPAVAGPPLAQ
jgi:hypothetical protein